MNRSVLVALTTALVLGGGLAGSALASPPDNNRQKLCINTGAGDDDLLDPQYCITWVPPIADAAQQ